MYLRFVYWKKFFDCIRIISVKYTNFIRINVGSVTCSAIRRCYASCSCRAVCIYLVLCISTSWIFIHSVALLVIVKHSNFHVNMKLQCFTRTLLIHAKRHPYSVFLLNTSAYHSKFEPAIPHFATSLTIHRGKLSILLESIMLHWNPSKSIRFVVFLWHDWMRLDFYGFP